MPDTLFVRRITAAPCAGLITSIVLAGCHFSYDRTLKPGELRGTVVFSGSPGAPAVPVGGAHVTIENSSITVPTDAQGEFAIQGLPRVKYTIDITFSTTGNGVVDAGLRLTGVDLGTDASGARDLGALSIGALGGIAGTVTDGTTLLNGAVVGIAGIATTLTAQGAYAFTEFLPGDYALTAFEATGMGERVSATQQVVIAPRKITQIEKIDLSQAMVVKSGSAAGQVLVQGGGATPTITVTLATLTTISQTADSSGNYNLAAVPAGVYTVVASAPGYVPASAAGVTIAGPPTAVPLLMLSPVAVAAAQMGTPTGVPDAGTVTTTESDAGQSAPPSQSEGGSTQAQSPNFRSSSTTGSPQVPQSSPNFRFTPTGVTQTFRATGGAQ